MIIIVAAVITPSPDVFSQMLVAIPLYLLYEVSIVVVKRIDKERAAAEAKEVKAKVKAERRLMSL